MKVLNFGSMNLDYVYQVSHFVEGGETLSATSMQVNPGGKGLNQSIALAAAGSTVHHAGNVGIGGEKLVDLLKEKGVHTDDITQVDVLQGNAMIQVNSNAENCIVLFGGSNQTVTSKQIDEVLNHYEKGDFLVLQNEVNQIDEIIEKAHEKGLIIFLNPSPYNEKLNDALFGYCAWILVNEVEAFQMSGENDPEKAFEVIHEKYPDLSVLFTLGENGSVAYQVQNGQVEVVKQNAFSVSAVDTTAAGDTFTGYFVTGIALQKGLKRSMLEASAASAIAVSRAGAAESIPCAAEVEEFLKKLVI